MLARCLAAVNELQVPAGVEILTIVIGNEGAEESRPIAERFGAQYAQEPELGIPFARNAAVRAALAEAVDFIVFFDDDVAPEPDWLEKALLVQRLTGAAVVRGRQVPVYPDPLPTWVLKRQKKGRGRGVHEIAPRGAACNNILYSSSIFRKGLRFDARYRFMTGEDSDLAHRIAEAGGLIVGTEFSIVHEEVAPARCTFARQVARQYAYAQGNTLVEKDRGRHSVAALEGALAALHAIESLALAIIAGGLTASVRRFRKHILRAGQKAGYAAGVVASLLGRTYEPYRVVDGR